MSTTPHLDATGSQLRRELADDLEARGALHSPAWRAAVETVPREAFLGERVYQRIDGPGPTQWRPRTPDTMRPDQWLTLAYRDETLVTQLDHTDTPNAPATGIDGVPVPGEPTSSSTLPSVVVRMLEDLQIDDGARVLEIGTGTGYSTALMCERLGSGNVTSIEVDPGIAGRARQSLATAGYTPTLICGDGLAGDPTGALYDAVIATCSVRSFPAPWMDQVRIGGTVLATLSGWLLGSALARIHITGPNTGQGRILPGFTQFMPARPHAAPPLHHLPSPDGYTERDTPLGPDRLTDPTGRFLAQLAAPAAQYLPPYTDAEIAMHLLYDRAANAWARLYQTPTGTWKVRQAGPVNLWDDIESSWTAWIQAGRPAHHELTIDITPASQTVTLPTPHGQRTWRLP
ncbi:methyltransferase of ATP-grasp peptide maturase system [Kribbella aluminosa]|uniref:Protein-L-isoaspartate O-methyltransferase n=1 Tax=Kribbella aluminosa TaxID=416017 RepID=A0ABS4UBB5_9ACTN|nr:ATP-grasp peptide maturase system methyltransferase [Kribbella aluminosa]MBP2348943.1 methyltransferase of ATP-grasp peptide maturase system [Kribbella aluminosa]